MEQQLVRVRICSKCHKQTVPTRPDYCETCKRPLRGQNTRHKGANGVSMPVQKPGESKQDYGTPRDFLDAVEMRFGFLEVDLAAHKDNAKAKDWLGPGSPLYEDALSVPWVSSWVAEEKIFWLNPPFGKITPWAKKCAEEAQFLKNGRILFLVPAAVGSNWFAKYVFNKALVLIFRPRLVFEGEKDPYIKDCMLCVYGEKPGIDLWQYK